MQDDPRRRIPRTDALAGLAPVRAAEASRGRTVVRGVIRAVQDSARRGEIAPEEVEAQLLRTLAGHRASSLRPVLNATGVIIHTNLGRAPLAASAVRALVEASGYVDVEMDLDTGARSRRGAGARAALLRACPPAEEALVVNNGAAALMLAASTFAGVSETPEIVVSRGEFIEIGAGFRLTDLMTATGARLREVGTTNRTHVEDYAAATGPTTGMLLKVHPSNFRIEGFTAEAEVPALGRLAAEHRVPLVVDIGSGLLAPDAQLPEEPDAASVLAAGADAVIASGDKLLGGPQAGIVLGRAEVVSQMARHPTARAVRADKLTLAALEATLHSDEVPVTRALHAEPERLRLRTQRLADALDVSIVEHDGRVGGGGGAGVPLPGLVLALPEQAAGHLRTGDPAVLPRVTGGACLLDLRCVPEDRDDDLLAAAAGALERSR